MKRLYGHVLSVLLSSVFPYVAAFVYVSFAAVQFFLVQQFFTTGTSDLRQFFTAFPTVSIVVIPALCASVPYRGRELSYPLSSVSVIAAQVLAVLTLCAGMIVLTLTVPLAVSLFGDVELPPLLCGYALLLLYSACAVSACLFLGTTISQTGAAFLAGAALLALSSFSHLVPLYVNLPEWIQTLFRSLSFAWHFDAASKGIIDTQDILFFIIATLAFIASGALCLECKRGNKSLTLKRLVLLSVTAFVLLFADSALIRFRIDTTTNRQFTVSAYSKTLVQEVQDPLTISYYRSKTLKDLYPQIVDVEDFLRAYADESKYISFELVDPAKNSNAELLNRHGIYGQTIDTSGRETTSYATVYSAVVISYLGSTEVLPFVLDTTTLEYDLTSRIQSLVRGTVRSVQVLVGNSLDIQSDYAYVIPWLQSQGFVTVQTYLPSQCEENADLVPFTQLKSVPLLMLGSSSCTPSDARALEDFIASGSKALIATTPYEIAVGPEGDWSVSAEEDALDLMLFDFGIFFYNSLTADISNFTLTLTSSQTAEGLPTTERTEYLNYPLWPSLMAQTNAPTGMTLFWPCAIDLDDTSALSAYHSTLTPVLLSSDHAWQIKAVDGKFETNPFAVPQTSEDATLYRTFNFAVHALMDSSGGQLYVWGDQYALTTQMLSYGASSSSADFRAYDFLTDTLLKLNGQEQILTLKNRNIRDMSLYKMDATTRLSCRSQTLALVIGIPCLLLLALYVFFFTKRKNFNRGL